MNSKMTVASNTTRSLVALFTLFSAAVIAQHRDIMTLMPIDEAVSEPGLVEVRAATIDALRHRDFERLLTYVADDVHTLSARDKPSFAGIVTGTYRAGLVTEQMRAALLRGGSFTTTRGSIRGERQFCAPYTYGAYPAEVTDLRPMNYPWVLIGKDVAVRRRPGVDAPIVTRLSYRLVYVSASANDLDAQGTRWAYIEIPEGGRGYVHPSLIEKPTALHVCLGRRGDGWRITAVDEATALE